MATRLPDFAELLRRERRAQGLTQAELAERAQLSERAISDMERGLKVPHRATVRMLAEALRLVPERVDELEAARRARRQHTADSGAQPTPHSLPTARTTFIGRQRLLADVRRLTAVAVEGSRLLTLTGPGGTGKSRVAVEAARGMLDQYPDGVFYVELGPISDPSLVASTVAQALGVSTDGRQPPLNVLKNYLRDRQLLLILDNFEQLLGAAEDVAALLLSCAGLHVWVTSRAPLRLVGEIELTVPPLALPDREDDDPDALEQCESVQLFIERVRAVRSDFVLTDDNAGAVAEICRRLDGLPLALELAAARTRLLEPRAMLAPLEHRLQLLTSGPRDAPARQQTLRNTITWSYGLLTPEEQALFRHVSVFVGGCSLEAAQAVHAEGDILDLIESLVAKNLLRPHDGANGEARVAQLETIREFGLEQLAWTGELEPIRRRHALYFLALAEQAEPALGGLTARAWLDRMSLEHDNLRAALDWSLGQPGQNGDLGVRLAGALARFWWIAGHFREGSSWLDRALAARFDGSAARMKALYGAGWLAHMQRDLVSARTLLSESLIIAENVHDDWARAWVTHVLGRAAYLDGDSVGARQCGEASLRIAQAIGDRWLIGWAVHLLGLAAHIAGDDPSAHSCYQHSLSIRRELGHLEGVAIVLHLDGMLYHRAGDHAKALTLYRAALEAATELNAAWLVRTVLSLFAGLAAEWQADLGVRLGGAVTVMSESAHTLNIPLTEALFTHGMQAARRRLGEAAFATAWAHGRAMSLDMAIAAAWSVEVGPAVQFPGGLTATEVEVLRRLAGSQTSAQIAAELVVAVSTVDRHITHIYQKIGRRGRAAAAAFALEHGLT